MVYFGEILGFDCHDNEIGILDCFGDALTGLDFVVILLGYGLHGALRDVVKCDILSWLEICVDEGLDEGLGHFTGSYERYLFVDPLS